MIHCVRIALAAVVALSTSPGVVAAATSPCGQFIRRPFQQEAEPGVRTLHWISERPCSTHLRVSRANGAVVNLEGRAATNGTLELPETGGEIATWCLLDDAGTILDSGTYRDLPDASALLRVAVVGDSGTVGPTLADLAELLLPEHPDIVLHTGDVVYSNGGAEAYDQVFFSPLAPLIKDLPFFPVLGNHEAKVRDGQDYLDAFDLPHNNPDTTERYYSFDTGPAHVTCLDTASSPIGEESAQLRWAEEDLASSSRQWKIVVVHHPPVSSCQTELFWRLALVPVFEELDVDLVLCGHAHWYERTDPVRFFSDAAPEGPVYVTQGSAYGGTLDACSPESFSATSATTHSVTILDITTAAIHLRTIDIDGTVIDETDLSAHEKRSSDGGGSAVSGPRSRRRLQSGQS